jgi:hypothetical protein
VTEQTYNRIELAVEQLEIALSLFLEKQSFVGALTLAGAAEEILGKTLQRKAEQNSLDWKYENTRWWHAKLYGKPLSNGEFADNENRARNAAKHIGCANDMTVTVDLEDAALWMIVRAYDNFERLQLPRTMKMLDFDNWFHEHVVGW